MDARVAGENSRDEFHVSTSSRPRFEPAPAKRHGIRFVSAEKVDRKGLMTQYIEVYAHGPECQLRCVSKRN